VVKRVLSVSLCMIMLFSAFPSALAAGYKDDSKSSMATEMKKINSNQKDVKVSLLSSEEANNVINPGDPIKLNSYDDLETLINSMTSSDTASRTEQVFIDTSNQTQSAADSNTLSSSSQANSTALRTSSSVLNGTWTQSWNDSVWWQYLTLSWDCLINKNLKVDYTYNSSNKWYFVSATSATSWISGTTVARSWIQQGSPTMNIKTTNYYHDTLTCSVTGTYVLGVAVSVNGVTFPVGLSTTETWYKEYIFK
jgi:hypothetical protein